MKEVRYFYVPDALHSSELPEDEARHALRVLRLGIGDELYLMDGDGSFVRAEISAQTGHRCHYSILGQYLQDGRRALRDLRKAGLLETEQRYRTKGGKSSLLYKIRGG